MLDLMSKPTLSQQMNTKIEKEFAEKNANHGSLGVLMLGALGVVFGDIGTSPLYALKETFFYTESLVDLTNIYRFLSIIFWLLLIVVSFKYVTFVMRAGNKGEGGNFALLALVLRLTKPNPRLFYWSGLLGIAAGSLFYADAVITPAISVLSAVEGLKIVAPAFESFVVPLTIIIMAGLFYVQKYGTGKVGGVFGPIMLIWFLSIGFLGLVQIIKVPQILEAINPYYALEFVLHRPYIAFLSFSVTVLAVTGAEALYADMGHFGVSPIKRAWLFLVWPCLMLNYFGQGALLLQNPAAIENPFFLLAPKDFSMALLILATMATIIASQSVISGAFSLTRQAIQLGYLPRMRIVHTSEKTIGQIYIPLVNWTLLLAVVMMVTIFRSSSGLAAAYGLAVTGTMFVTSLLVMIVMRLKWNWKWSAIFLVVGIFLVVDLAVFASASTKIMTGGYIPLVIGLVIFTLLTTWFRGRKIIDDKISKTTISVENFVKDVAKNPPITVPGTAIYMTSRHNVVPSAMLFNIKHNKIIHERVIFLTVIYQDVPHIPLTEGINIQSLGHNIYRIDISTGFKDAPDVPAALQYCYDKGMDFDPVHQVSFFLSKESIVPMRGKEGMAFWREWLFAVMKNNSSNAGSYYRIPSNRICELGVRYEI